MSKDAAFQKQEVEEDSQGIVFDVRVCKLFTAPLNDLASTRRHGRANQQNLRIVRDEGCMLTRRRYIDMALDECNACRLA